MRISDWSSDVCSSDLVCDESVTTGRGFYPLTAGAPPHDWLQNMGGSIGLGLPLATGCAVACPDRKVVCLEGDGSGMYTVQALWTMAREKLDVTVLVFANRTYQILKGERSEEHTSELPSLMRISTAIFSM